LWRSCFLNSFAAFATSAGIRAETLAARRQHLKVAPLRFRPIDRRRYFIGSRVRVIPLDSLPQLLDACGEAPAAPSLSRSPLALALDVSAPDGRQFLRRFLDVLR
jgi:hypothetical protein